MLSNVFRSKTVFKQYIKRLNCKFPEPNIHSLLSTDPTNCICGNIKITNTGPLLLCQVVVFATSRLCTHNLSL